MSENREYKSDVFSMLMEDKNNALQVYNTLNESNYSDPEQVEIVKLERGISLTIRNDCAFIVDMSLNIYEHQSSYNPNMPLRSLIYFSSYIRQMTKNRDLFSSSVVKIPTPHFAVFYNGIKDRPPREIVKLSMSYEKPTDEPELELICSVYNINPGKDEKLLEKCSVLYEYMQFIETVRNYEADGMAEPVKQAIDYCIKNHILEEFLKEHREEVLKVMTIDMTFEKREALMHEEIEQERRRADEQAKRADEQAKRADEQKKRADEQKKRADAANLRADAIAAEFAKYKAEHP